MTGKKKGNSLLGSGGCFWGVAAFFHDQAWEYWLKSSDSEAAGKAAAVGIIKESSHDVPLTLLDMGTLRASDGSFPLGL